MARRKRKKKSAPSNPIPMIIGALVAFAIIALGYWMLTKPKSSDRYPDLPVVELQNNPESLRGSNFSVIAKIKQKPHHNERQGAVIFVDIIKEGKQYSFPFIVPAGIDGPNLSVEHTYIFNGIVNSKAQFIVSSYSDK